MATANLIQTDDIDVRIVDQTIRHFGFFARVLCSAIRNHVPGFFWTEAPIGEDPDKRDYIVSNEKLGRTGFHPEVSLDAGIGELVQGYQILRRGEFSNV